MQLRVVLVATVAMVAVGAGCGSGRSGPTAARPTTTGSTVAAPEPVIAAARSFAEESGDPHPALPVLWVATTRVHVESDSALQFGVLPNRADETGWMIQIRGDFSSCPCKGGAHGPGKEYLLFLPMVSPSEAVKGLPSEWSFGDQIHDLAALGPLHSFNL